MSNINIKINLAAFVCGVQKIKGKSGIEKECLIIPIDDNKLFRGKNGYYADLIAFEIKERKADQTDTHLIKQSFSKDYLDSLTEEKRKNLPIFGNAIDWSKITRVNQDTDLENASFDDSKSDDLPF